MCDVAERLEQKGKMAGEQKLASLISALLADNRQNDVARAASDIAYREKLYEEYHIMEE